MDCVTWQCRCPIDLKLNVAFVPHEKLTIFIHFFFHLFIRFAAARHRLTEPITESILTIFFQLSHFDVRLTTVDSGLSPWVAMRKMIIIDLKDIHFSKFVFFPVEHDGSSNASLWCPLMCVIILLKCIFLFDAHSNPKCWKSRQRPEPNIQSHRVSVAEAAIVVAAAAAENIMHIKFKLMIWWVLWAGVYGRNV